MRNGRRSGAARSLIERKKYDYNSEGVMRPEQSDASVVLFENEVDLGLASLRRQMIITHDWNGTPLYGLREIE